MTDSTTTQRTTRERLEREYSFSPSRAITPNMVSGRDPFYRSLGGIFWFSRKTLFGSYVRLIFARRSNLSAPHAARGFAGADVVDVHATVGERLRRLRCFTRPTHVGVGVGRIRPARHDHE